VPPHRTVIKSPTVQLHHHRLRADAGQVPDLTTMSQVTNTG